MKYESRASNREEERKKFFSRHPAIGALTAATLIGGSIAAFALTETNNDASNASLAKEVERVTPADGFRSDVHEMMISDKSDKSVIGTIALNRSCSLTEVTMDLKRKDGRVTDVTAYHIDGKAYPHVEHRYNGVAPQTVVEGAGATLTFANKEDLEKNILHSTDEFACQALAKAMEFQQNPNNLPMPSAAN